MNKVDSKLAKHRNIIMEYVDKMTLHEKKILEMRFGLIDEVPRTYNEIRAELHISAVVMRRVALSVSDKILLMILEDIND